MIAPMAAPVPVAPAQRRAERERRRKEQTKQDNKEVAFDKIKEYLHLTASAVKIKYPTVRGVASADLIKRVKELPFYKYHDQMVKIMENEIKKKREKQREKREKEKAEKGALTKPTMEKRNSLWESLDGSVLNPLPKRKKKKLKKKNRIERKQRKLLPVRMDIDRVPDSGQMTWIRVITMLRIINRRECQLVMVMITTQPMVDVKHRDRVHEAGNVNAAEVVVVNDRPSRMKWMEEVQQVIVVRVDEVRPRLERM